MSPCPDNEPQRTIHTIGYGGKNPSELVEELREHRIELVADVRMMPGRACMGSFVLAKEPTKGIQKLLADAGIEYVWLKELGNPDRKDPEMRVYRTTVWDELPDRTRTLVEMASGRATCMLCAEKDVRRCHRGIIGDFLRTEGWQVVDL